MSFQVSYRDCNITIPAETGRDYGREDFPHKPELMSALHFRVVAATRDSIQVVHCGKKDGVIEYRVSAITVPTTRDNALPFELAVNDVYRPMHDSSLRLKLVPTVLVTIDEVVCRSIRGHIFSGFEEERKKDGRVKPKDAKKYLPHDVYLTRFIGDGLEHKVTHNKDGAKWLLKIRDENEKLDQMVRREGLDFHQTDGGYIALPDRVVAERQALLARMLAEPPAENEGGEDIGDSNDEGSDAEFLVDGDDLIADD